jgi:hypothetical protein
MATFCDAKKLLRAAVSKWLMVFARGRIPPPRPAGPPTPLDTEFLRTRPEGLGGKPVVLSLRALRGREFVAPCWCSFCWCRSSRSRRAKHRAHWGHSNGFSFVCERSCRFRCSRRANDRVQVVQMCGRGLSVLGGGKVAAAVGDAAGFAVWLDAAIDVTVSLEDQSLCIQATYRCCCQRLPSRRWGCSWCAPASRPRLGTTW